MVKDNRVVDEEQINEIFNLRLFIMARRPGSPLYSKKYCGNTNKKEVHDLDKENTNCQIDEIIAAGHAKTFDPDTLEQAHKEDYDNCACCIGGSTR